MISSESFARAISSRWSSAVQSGSYPALRDLANVCHGAALARPDEDDYWMMAQIATMHTIQAAYGKPKP